MNSRTTRLALLAALAYVLWRLYRRKRATETAAAAIPGYAVSGGLFI